MSDKPGPGSIYWQPTLAEWEEHEAKNARDRVMWGKRAKREKLKLPPPMALNERLSAYRRAKKLMGFVDALTPLALVNKLNALWPVARTQFILDAELKAETNRRRRIQASRQHARRLPYERTLRERLATYKARKLKAARREGRNGLAPIIGMWTEEKQRRSRVDWVSSLPRKVADAQIAWERGATALALYDSCYTYSEIGVAFGVCAQRVRQIVASHSRKVKVLKQCSPAEEWFETVNIATDIPVGRTKAKAVTVAFNAALVGPKRDWLYV